MIETTVAEVNIRLPDGSTERRRLSVHPLAMMIPGMTDADFRRLEEDADARGIQEPLILFEGKVLDGRHRLLIAGSTGLPVQLTEFDGDEARARAFVWSVNVARRHLTVPQLALAAQRFGFIDAAKAEAPAAKRKWQNVASEKLGRSVTPRTLERFDAVRLEAAPETVAKIETGEIARMDVAVKAAAAERSLIEGYTVPVPPVVSRTAWDRLGCARGDILAAERYVLAGTDGGLDLARFANRAREMQAALIRIYQLLEDAGVKSA